ncbi:MAG: ribonuclease III [Gammaproteobacteria bacterium]|nr:ribonuclease III [Gammaproteobacteria bacterium]
MVEKLEHDLGYKFKDQKILDIALRHRSVGKESNERMEFLGDSILGFTIAAALFQLYPKYSEGILSRLRSNLVKKDTLAELGVEFKLGDYLQLGVGERKSGGFRRASILADAMEAVIGAIFLDSDITICQKQILRWYEKRLSGLTQVGQKDAKTELQELIQAKKLALPLYEVVEMIGEAHNQQFFVSCQVAELDIITKGEGFSKQAAEQDAAQQFLQELKNETTK